jgi:5,10-methylenetetrahydrofolate reductase
MIMANGGTFTDDADANPTSLIEIKCADNKAGTPITVGIKTTILQNGKNLRVYATLYGTIPSPQYKQTN